MSKWSELLDHPNTLVWLSNAGSRVAHSCRGAVDVKSWRTECGQPIQVIRSLGGVMQFGNMIEWRLLNHDLVKSCRKCFR